MTTTPETNGQVYHPATFRRSDSIAAFAAALAKAQGMMSNAAKDSANPFFKSKYADLASVWDAIREPLSKNNIAVIQVARSTPEGVEVETALVHGETGEMVSEVLRVPVAKHDVQGVGSAITYARRYALQTMCGVAPDDDDGNAAANSQRYAGNNSVEANTTTREQRAATPQVPQEPVKVYCTPQQKDAMTAISQELGLSSTYWTTVLKEKNVKRLGNLTAENAAEVILSLCRRRVSELLTELCFNLDDVRKENPNVAADIPDELSQEEADAALTVLRACKERMANV